MTSFSRYYDKHKTLVDISMAEIENLLKDESNKEIIATHLYERLYNRFLKIFDYHSNNIAIYEKNGDKDERNIFNEEYKNGFLIMASCSLLIETFASFLLGQKETPWGKSADMFNKVFEYAEQKNNPLKYFKNLDFYKNIRCGLLHQGETYGKFKVTRKGETLFKNETIDAVIFHRNLKSLLEDYKSDLANGKWDSIEWIACRHKIEHIIENSK